MADLKVQSGNQTTVKPKTTKNNPQTTAQQKNVQLFCYKNLISDPTIKPVTKLPVSEAAYKPEKGHKAYIKTTKEDVINQTGLRESFINELIENEDIKLNQYTDSAGKKTIGIGHNIDADPFYNYGQTITKEQAFELLKKDLIKAQNNLEALVGKKELKKLKLNQGQKEALVDLIFNVGIEKLTESKLIEKLKSGKLKEVPAEMNFILYKNGFSAALCKRRLQNIKAFNEDGSSAEAITAMQTLFKIGSENFNKKIEKASGFSYLSLLIKKYVFAFRANKQIEEAQENYKKKILEKR